MDGRGCWSVEERVSRGSWGWGWKRDGAEYGHEEDNLIFTIESLRSYAWAKCFTFRLMDTINL
jgi:hypothetical protein